ncbi:hypothetical protein KIN20_009619 [Parelaphostrongylus tenuis]|uniref:Uncharacterized protein n=1 Tax=Parelaphostrongylus tenuis TaxID=148309 RepID=A0AAD5MS17_PARTN|nr:hypothetical protein KIN20_009619 [Parelaphostrongylus tenuis]
MHVDVLHQLNAHFEVAGEPYRENITVCCYKLDTELLIGCYIHQEKNESNISDDFKQKYGKESLLGPSSPVE